MFLVTGELIYPGTCRFQLRHVLRLQVEKLRGHGKIQEACGSNLLVGVPEIRATQVLFLLSLVRTGEGYSLIHPALSPVSDVLHCAEVVFQAMEDLMTDGASPEGLHRGLQEEEMGIDFGAPSDTKNMMSSVPSPSDSLASGVCHVSPNLWDVHLEFFNRALACTQATH